MGTLSHFRSTVGALGTCGTQSSQPSNTLGTWDWRDAVISAHQVSWGLAGLRPSSSPGTLGTGRTQSFQAFRYPEDWRDSVLRPPGTLRTGGTQSFQALRCPEDWRDPVLSGPQVPCGLARLSPFRPLGTLGTWSPGDWQDSVLPAPQVPWGLAGLSPFRPSGTLRTGGIQSLGPQVP